MATQTEQIAASQAYQQVPADWKLEFQRWSDSGLLSLLEDSRADVKIRSYARWELDYRLAFGRTALPERELPKADRSRWTMAGAAKTIREEMSDG